MYFSFSILFLQIIKYLEKTSSKPFREQKHETKFFDFIEEKGERGDKGGREVYIERYLKELQIKGGMQEGCALLQCWKGKNN